MTDAEYGLYASQYLDILKQGYRHTYDRRFPGEQATGIAMKLWGITRTGATARVRTLREQRPDLWAPIQAEIDRQDAAAREPQATIQPNEPKAVDTQLRERRLEQKLAEAKAREKELLDRIISLEDVRGEVMEIRDALGNPDFIQPDVNTKDNPTSAILHISDVHAGEHVGLHEMDGLNSYDEAICRARLHRLFKKAVKVIQQQWDDNPLDELVVALGGDMIDGNLREESRRGGAMAVVPSVTMVSEALAGGFEFLRSELGLPIRAYTSPGNHGRLTPKPHATEGGIDNLDVIVSWGIEKILGKQDWAKFFYSGSGENLFNIYGWWFLLRHGHEGSGGSGGMYGPVYKQVRGMYKAHNSYARRGRGFHFVLQGHDHTPSKLPFGFANSSVVGYTPFAMRTLMADPSPASQNLLIVNRTHGVIAHHELFLGVPDEGTLYQVPELNASARGVPNKKPGQ